MSVEAVQRKSGRVWRVRWRDANGQTRSRVIGNKADAKLFDADLVRRQRMGQLARIDDGKQTVGRLAETWFSTSSPGADPAYMCLPSETNLKSSPGRLFIEKSGRRSSNGPT